MTVSEEVYYSFVTLTSQRDDKEEESTIGECCDGCYKKTVKIEDLHAIENYSVTTKLDPFIFEMHNVNFQNDKISGCITINVPSKAFNHAACNTYTYINDLSDFEYDPIIINYDIWFDITDVIRLTIIPKIVV